MGPDGSFELTRISGPIFLRVQLTDAQGRAGTDADGEVHDEVGDRGRCGCRGYAVRSDARRARPEFTLVLTDKVTEIGGTVTDGLERCWSPRRC